MTLMVAGTEGHAVIFRGKLYFKSSKVPGADGQKPWTDLPAAHARTRSTCLWTPWAASADCPW